MRFWTCAPQLIASVLVTATFVTAQPYVNYRGVVNAASYAPQGLPAGSIARGSIFTLFGRNLGPQPFVLAVAFPLENQLAGVSVQISQDGISLPAYPIFVLNSQVSAIMPSNAPLGRVVVRLSFNGQRSNPAVVNVVEASPGLFAINSAGFGPGIVQNFESEAEQPINTARVTARPGQAVILWGTGLGAANHPDNIAPTPTDFGGAVEVFVGGKPAPRRYAGRSSCCAGLDQIVFDIPVDAPEGCNVPVQVRTRRSVVSNTVTVAIQRDGMLCRDPFNPVAEALRSGGRIGLVLAQRLSAIIEPFISEPENIESDQIYAAFQDEPGGELVFNPLLSLPPPGSCTTYGTSVLRNEADVLPLFAAANQLDAGDVAVLSGESGRSASVSRAAASPRIYAALLGKSTDPSQSSRLVLNPPGPFALRLPGGAALGAIEARFSTTAAIQWTNRSQLTSIDRTRDLGVNWIGADPSRDVVLIVGTSADAPRNSAGAFVCVAPPSQGQFNVPSHILAALPATPLGTLDVAGKVIVGAVAIQNPVTFTGTGLGAGFLVPGSFSVKSAGVR